MSPAPIRFEHAQPIDPGTFEEWVAYPDRRAYVPHRDQVAYAFRPGWFRSGWLGTEEQAARLRGIQQATVGEAA